VRSLFGSPELTSRRVAIVGRAESSGITPLQAATQLAQRWLAAAAYTAPDGGPAAEAA
jgi:hypothetical protein